MKNIILLFFIATFSSLQAQVNIIPQPEDVKLLRAPNLLVDSLHTIKYYDESFSDEAEYLQSEFYKLKGKKLKLYLFPKGQVLDGVEPGSIILGYGDSTAVNVSGKYVFSIYATVCFISGGEEGVFWGIQSLLQLIHHSPSSIRAMQITDQPRFQWRGMHLDVSRHFFPKEFIKKYIDVLAMHKMNVFHWHLTDDQGWRIEIKKYPKLTSIGGWRNNSMIGHYNENKFDNIKHDGYYTQEDIKEIVNYANVRHVTIVPEIEMPGHSLAALAAYPQYSCTAGKFDVANKWGVFEDVYCAGNDSTFYFLQDVLSEVMELFPGQYIHIGGDECPKTRWEKCTKCQKRIKDEKLKDEHELQSYFIQRIEKFVNSKGKKIIGWDEILEGGLAPNATVMSWRGTEGGIKAAKQDHDVVMTPGSHCYFDHYQGNPRNEPVAIGGFTTVEKVYSYEPVPEELNEEEAKHILGAQGNVWTEYMTTTEHVEYMALPRLCALSEVLWSTKENRNEEDFLKRLEKHFDLLKQNDINFSNAYFSVKYELQSIHNGVKIVFDTTKSWNRICKFVIDDRKIEDVYISHPKYEVDSIEGNQIEIYRTGTLMMKYNHPNAKASALNLFISKATSKTVTYKIPPVRPYSTDPNFTLVNGIKGTLPRNNSEWLGWSGSDVELTIDLGKITEISKVVINSLEDHHNWIWLPEKAEIYFSKNGKKWKSDSRIVKAEEGYRWKDKRRFTASFKTKKTRYVKIYLKNARKINVGNPGEGSESWIFLDEIEIY